MGAIAAHFRYIAKAGRLPFEDDRGVVRDGKEALRALTDQWRYGGSEIGEASPRREAFNVILSMPSGTDPLIVQRAAREFAKAEFADHRYVMVLHDHQANPHVHLSVRAESKDGKRLNPRKADLQRWRERFAARLQDHGINAVATRAAARGLAPMPKQLWRIQAADQSRERKPRANSRTADAVSQARSRAIEAWGHLANALAASPEGQDQQLALEVVRYVGQQFGKAGPGRVLHEELSRRGIAGIDPADPTSENPEQKNPTRGR